MKVDIKRLEKVNNIIVKTANDFGLDFFPQEFDIIPSQKMLEIMAYHLPVNYSHWSFGRDYEIERTKYEHGFGIPYEVVLNSDPSRAYLMNTNPFAVQVLVMAHVYAHNDFMKNNIHFSPVRRDMIPSASEAAARFRKYEKDYGAVNVEKVIDAGMSIELNIDPDFFIKTETEEEQRDRLLGTSQSKKEGEFDDLLTDGRRKLTNEERERVRTKIPPEPDQDILNFIINNSPKPLREWQKDVLSLIRMQSLYFMPQRRTKIMNEGWATYWHMKIMNRLFQEGYLTGEEHGFYNLYNSRVIAFNRRSMNPYLVGSKILTDIEDRWNRGCFGKEWDECSDYTARKNWNKNIGEGRAKIFEVRRSYSDWFFMDHFLTEDLIDKLDLYIYQAQEYGNEIRWVIVEKDWKVIKELITRSLSHFGIPKIMVEDGDFGGRTELYLKHYYDGMPLDQEYVRRTMEHIYYLWNRPIHLETIKKEMNKDQRKLLTYNGSAHLEVNL
ncbi:MAG: SpoVR family protein [bacterium]